MVLFLRNLNIVNYVLIGTELNTQLHPEHPHVSNLKLLSGTSLRGAKFCTHNSRRLHDFPGGSDGKESACDAGDLGSIPGSERKKRRKWQPWRRKWEPTPVFLLENPMDRGAWQATAHDVAKSQTLLSN